MPALQCWLQSIRRMGNPPHHIRQKHNRLPRMMNSRNLKSRMDCSRHRMELRRRTHHTTNFRRKLWHMPIRRQGLSCSWMHSYWQQDRSCFRTN
jgi:hypothetical protein